MERITPENETLVGFFDLDGDPNEGHENEQVTPQIARKPANSLAAEGEGPETVIDMTAATDVPTEEEPPAEEEPPVEEKTPPAEEEKEEQQAAASVEKKKTPYQIANDLKRELAEQKRINEEIEQKRQAAERLVQEHQQRLQAVETYLQHQAAAVKQAATPQEPPVEIPPYEENPLENLRGQLSETQKIIQGYNERQQQLEKESVLNRFEAKIANDEVVYSQKNPDYYNARDYLYASARKEANASGMKEEQFQELVQGFRVHWAQQAWTQGITIAEIVEKVAIARGYQPRQGQIVEQNDPQERTKTESREKVRVAVAREQQATSSLATASRTNGRPPTRLTKDVVMRMTEADMERMDQENPGWMERYMSQE